MLRYLSLCIGMLLLLAACGGTSITERQNTPVPIPSRFPTYEDTYGFEIERDDDCIGLIQEDLSIHACPKHMNVDGKVTFHWDNPIEREVSLYNGGNRDPIITFNSSSGSQEVDYFQTAIDRGISKFDLWFRHEDFAHSVPASTPFTLTAECKHEFFFEILFQHCPTSEPHTVSALYQPFENGFAVTTSSPFFNDNKTCFFWYRSVDCAFGGYEPFVGAIAFDFDMPVPVEELWLTGGDYFREELGEPTAEAMRYTMTWQRTHRFGPRGTTSPIRSDLFLSVPYYNENIPHGNVIHVKMAPYSYPWVSYSTRHN